MTIELIGFAAEVEALAHRAVKLPLSSHNPETKYVARQELAHALGLLAHRMRKAAEPDKPVTRPIKKIVPGVITSRNGNVIPISSRAPFAVPKKS